MSATTIRLWYVRETASAFLYDKLPPDRRSEGDFVWIPKSIVEHRTKRGNEHEVKLPDWFIEKSGL